MRERSESSDPVGMFSLLKPVHKAVGWDWLRQSMDIRMKQLPQKRDEVILWRY